MFLRSRLREDRGAALVAVIGVTAVTAIIGLAITAATLNALGTTTSNRAATQSRAAAEAGIDAALVGLKATNGCMTAGGTWSSTLVPSYSVTIAFALDSDPSVWTEGCPTDDADFIKLTSTGTAQQSGVSGHSNGDEVTLAALYKWKPIITQVPIAGAAVYAHQIQGVFKKFQLDSVDNSVATSVMIAHGDLECTNSARIGGDLILGDGDATLDMCDVAGSMHINGDTSVNKSTIGGAISVTGSLTIANSTYNAALASSGPGVPAPLIPDWKDIGWDPAYWTAHGYTVVDWAGPCDITKDNSPWEDLDDYTTPTVINFLNACPTSAVTTANAMNSVEINTDIVFVANQFTFDKLYFTSGATHNVTFLVPDLVPDTQPTCNPPASLTGDITLTNETDFSDKIAAMIYTPCKIYSDRNGFRGQMYGGEVEFKQQASLVYVPVGVVGVDFSNGLTTPVQSGAELGDPISVREVG